MKTSTNFLIKSLSAGAILTFLTLTAEGTDKDKYFKPVEEQNIYQGTDGFAPNNLSGKTVVFDDSQASLMGLQCVVKNFSRKGILKMKFDDNITLMGDPKVEAKMIEMAYKKLRPNVVVIAQEEEALDGYSEQYILMFTSPTEGVAQCARIPRTHLESIVVNIRFRIE